MRTQFALLTVCTTLLSCVSPTVAQDSVEVFIPPAIGARELDWVKHSLALSQAQSPVFDRYYVLYLERWKAVHDEREAHVRAAGFHAGSLFLSANGEFGQDAVDAYAMMNSLRLALLKESESIDDELWNQLQPLLAEAQWPQLSRVRQQRKRDRCPVTNRALPGAGTDLVRILRTLQIEVATGSDLDLLLVEYDGAITSLWLELDEYLTTSETAEFQAAVDFLFVESPPGHVATTATGPYDAQIRSLAKPALRLQRRIAIINRIFAPQIASSLNHDQSQLFRASYERVAFPSLYPDPFDPTDVFVRLMLAKTIPDELHPVLRGIWTEYRDGYAAICQSLERKQSDRQEEFALTRGSVRMREIQEDIQRLGQERRERNNAVVDRLYAALPNDVAATCRTFRDDYLTRVEHHRRAVETIGHQRP